MSIPCNFPCNFYEENSCFESPLMFEEQERIEMALERFNKAFERMNDNFEVLSKQEEKISMFIENQKRLFKK